VRAPDFEWRLIDRSGRRRAELRARPGDAEVWALRQGRRDAQWPFATSI
jgi:hypothetical protein